MQVITHRAQYQNSTEQSLHNYYIGLILVEKIMINFLSFGWSLDNEEHFISAISAFLFLSRYSRGMEWGGRGEEGSGWETYVHLWQIHFDIWQN